MTLSGHSRCRNQAIADYGLSMASGTYGMCECVECQETGDRGQGVWLNRRFQPFYGNSYKACVGWIGCWRPRSEQTSSMVGCDEPANGGWSRNPGTLRHEIRQPFADAPSLAHGSRGDRRAMSRYCPHAYSRTFVATSRGTSRRRNCERASCSVVCAPRRRMSHTKARRASHAGRGLRLVAHAEGATRSRIAWNRMNEQAPTCSVVEPPSGRTSRMGASRALPWQRRDMPMSRTFAWDVVSDAETEPRSADKERCLALHGTYSKARLMSNV